MLKCTRADRSAARLESLELKLVFKLRLDFLPKTFDSLRTDGGAIIPVSV